MVAFLHSLELIVLVSILVHRSSPRWPFGCMSGLSDHAEDLITRVTLLLGISQVAFSSFVSSRSRGGQVLYIIRG